MATADDLRAYLKVRLVESGVPAQLHDGLTEYLTTRRPTGDFLRAVLSNDLKEAVTRADHICRVRLYEIVFFLHAYASAQAWGSPAAVTAWLADPSPAPLLFE